MASGKLQLRQEAQTRREHLAAAAPQAGAEAAAHFIGKFNPTPNDIVGVYWPHKTELDTRPLLDELVSRGVVCALPAVQQGERILKFHTWKSGDELRRGAYGISEPSPSSPIVGPTILAVPLLAFDPTGHRLGYGVGYYDVTLRQMRLQGSVTAVGFAFAGQRLDNLPAEPHDELLDAIVTERGVQMTSAG